MDKKDLIGLKGVSAELITKILDGAFKMKKVLLSNQKKISLLNGKSVFLMFYEPSTRTSSSFDQAAKVLGANLIKLSVNSSSVKKGENLIDTGKTLDSMKADILVIRHFCSGVAKLLAQNVQASVINAGDGLNEHPTQALLDMMTMKEKWDSFVGKKVALIGDIKHSRVARSNIWGLTAMGAKVTVCGPATLMPANIENFPVTVAKTKEQAVSDADAIMGLRLQLERQDNGMFPSIREYHRYYGIDQELLKIAKKDVLVMHPGPVNRGVEIESQVKDGQFSYINEQVTNGVAVRMAVMAYLTCKLDEFMKEQPKGAKVIPL
ncbi:MAG TPA: aspartate carbamoyltransferase catalytic subunit [Clostridiales bacterium]|nr:aspartate carbamoyltransferase catalytic subunit [Clostridiales bacterium]